MAADRAVMAWAVMAWAWAVMAWAAITLSRVRPHAVRSGGGYFPTARLDYPSVGTTRSHQACAQNANASLAIRRHFALDGAALTAARRRPERALMIFTPSHVGTPPCVSRSCVIRGDRAAD